ncbi:MAG: hypothetical protein HKO13_01480 [Sphingomonas sp.]|nr:hypothetical protein [Sphingomonas sp.]
MLMRTRHGWSDNPDAEDVRAALESAADATRNRFVIIENDEDHYMQTLAHDDGWWLEKRTGGAEHHYRAEKEGGPLPVDKVDREDVLEALLGYLNGNDQGPGHLIWAKISV